MAITIIDVTGRYAFRSPLIGTAEMSEVLAALIVVLAMAATQRAGEHVGMDLLLIKLKERESIFYPILQLFGLLCCELVFLTIFYYCIRTFIAAAAINATTAGPLYITMKPVWLLICISLFFLCIRFVLQSREYIQAILIRSKS